MKIRLTFDITHEFREFVTAYYGLGHLATRDDVADFIRTTVSTSTE